MYLKSQSPDFILLYLQNYTVVYKQGKCNLNSDALLRVEMHNEETSSLAINHSETAYTSTKNPILEISISD